MLSRTPAPYPASVNQELQVVMWGATLPRTPPQAAEAVPRKPVQRWMSDRLENLQKGLEARGGIEPPNKGFADLCLTTWLPRLKEEDFRGPAREAVR